MICKKCVGAKGWYKDGVWISCTCALHDELVKYYRQASLDITYLRQSVKKNTFSVNSTTNQTSKQGRQKGYNQILEFVKTWNLTPNFGQNGLFLTGGPGVGKTLLFYIWLNSTKPTALLTSTGIVRIKRLLFRDVLDLLLRSDSIYQVPEFSMDILYIDKLGMEGKHNSAESILTEVLDFRNSRQLITIIEGSPSCGTYDPEYIYGKGSVTEHFTEKYPFAMDTVVSRLINIPLMGHNFNVRGKG